MPREDDLYTYCQWNFTDDALKILSSDKGLDLTIRDGGMFKLTVKHDNAVLLQALRDYYKEYALGDDVDSPKYKTALFELKKIVGAICASYDLRAKGLYEILSEYINPEDDEEESNVHNSALDNFASQPRDDSDLGNFSTRNVSDQSNLTEANLAALTTEAYDPMSRMLGAADPHNTHDDI